ncbi:unnamed protein product [Effrenium voratum]|nr:unnamed protein product [Effrenium voratum]
MPTKKADPKAKAKEPNQIHCPHCAFEIDPRQLHRLKVPPEALSVSPGPWQRPQTATSGYQVMPAAIAAAPVPPGTAFHGQVPASFFQTSHGWWAQSPESTN